MEKRIGTFYGVSVGPGDPELMTLQAVRRLENCPVIAAPQTPKGGMLALDIAKGAVDLSGKTILPLRFAMSLDPAVQKAAHIEAARAVKEYLDAGQDVAMLNLGDLSVRALETLRSADFIAAEDTRVSMKLLNHFDIKKPLVSYHEHNRAAAGQAILARLLAGETCALVTDAGTPAISDPGEDLVRLCGENGVTVQAIPGCCAAVCALAVSGLPTGRFTFEGFLSANKKERREALTRLAAEERTMVFHEAPHKLRPTLTDMLELLGDRPVALCRELTKLHEETIRTTLSGAVALYREKEPRGEYVLVVAGAPRQEAPALTLAEGVAMVQSLRQQGQRMKDAVRRVAEDTGLSRNELYQAALQEE